MNDVMIITGTRKGIGRYLVDYYLKKGYRVAGCSRQDVEVKPKNYRHYCLDVSDEPAVQNMVQDVVKEWGRVDVLINNAGIASMNHVLLTPLETVKKIFSTNVYGGFVFSREAAKIMMSQKSGRIVNFATVATPLNLEGESAYAASKAAIESFTRIMARELASFHVTVNAVGPTPVKTDLVKNVSKEKMDALIRRQALPRFGEFADISNVIDFFIGNGSGFITGQTIYLGGVN